MPNTFWAVATSAAVLATPAIAQADHDPHPADTPDTEVVVTARALPLTTRLSGQTVTSVTADAVRDTAATSLADIVKLAPGVVAIQGNGPRDVSVSIRGSNARSNFGARNIQVFEDDFPVTQPDGLARFDLTDPHAYGAVDVVRGPSSALYGNYALGGAINFRLRRGRDLQGVEVGSDFGGDGYANAYVAAGAADDRYDISVFGSLVGGDGATGHTGYRTATINGLASVALGDRDRVAVKVIHNQGEFRLSSRLSFNQYLANPYQRGCARAATAAAGCATISVLVNGINGARIAQTAAEADLARDDRRTIVGARYEHDFGPRTTWRTQVSYDSRVPFQPTSATPFKGTLNSYAITSDLTDRHELFGLGATSFVQLSYNDLDNRSFTFNKTPAGRNGLGALVQTVFGHVRNLGLRAREELKLSPRLDLVLGLGAERSRIAMRQTAYAYPPVAAPTQNVIPADRKFWNVAPEAALAWRPVDPVRLHARFGTGYGIPQAGNLFVTPAGVFGNNVALKPQKNSGIDLGAEVAIGRTLKAEITGYQEWFRNELVTQSAGVNLLAYTANAPRSVHRGVEVGLDWRPLPGARVQASYGYNDHHYTDFVERLTAGAVSRTFDRAGRAIPGVVPHFANLRLGYDQPGGALAGLGGYAEVTRRSRFYLDNGNLLAVPGYTLVNLNLHYDPPPGDGWWRRLSLYASVQNLFDRTYVGAASVIADGLDPATGRQRPASALMNTTGSLYAGQPRTLFVGIKSRF